MRKLFTLFALPILSISFLGCNDSSGPGVATEAPKVDPTPVPDGKAVRAPKKPAITSPEPSNKTSPN